MLMQNFKPAADLGISEAQKDALIKTLVLLETNKLIHAPVDDVKFDARVRSKYTNHFNMRYWAAHRECGTICCLAGTANRIGGLAESESLIAASLNTGNRLVELFSPSKAMPITRWGEITPTQAARALRSYLTTGDAKWAEAVSHTD